MRRWIAVLALAVLALAPAMAQELTSGVLEGRVTSQSGDPIADAVITLVGPQGVRTTTTDADGRFAVRNITSGAYTVKAEAPGYGTVVQSDVQVNIGSRTQLPFTLQEGKVEEVTVTSQAPIVDMKSTSAGETVRVDDFAPYVPLGRNIVSTFSIAPGVSDGGTVGASNQSISGASGLENAYFVDGVNITNSGYGALGAYSIVYGSLGTGVTYDFLEEVQVKTGGFEAEYGQAGGGVVNSVVRSGTNDMSVNFGWYESPASLESAYNPVVLSPYTTNFVERNRRDISLSIGGPIVQDKLFYFLAYNPIWLEDTFELTNGVGGQEFDFNEDGVIDDDEVFQLGETISGGRVPETVVRERKIDNYAGKLSWFLTPNHRFEVTAFGDPSEGDVGPQSPGNFYNNLLIPPSELPDIDSVSTGLDWGGDQISVKYQAVWTPNFFTELQYANKKNNFSEIGPGTQLRNYYDEDANVSFGGAGFYENQLDETDQYSLKLTWLLGPVEFKVGGLLEDINYAQPQQYSGPTYLEYFPRLVEGDIDTDGDGVADETGNILLGDGSLGDSYTAVQSSTGAAVDIVGGSIYNVTRTAFDIGEQSTTAEERNIFGQISWDILPNLTLKAGARWTEQELTGAGSFNLPIGALPDGTTTGALSTTYSPRTYTFDDEIAPRIGVAWDVLSNGKHKLFANYGEYYQRVPNDLAVRQFSNEVGVEFSEWNDSDLTDPTLDGECWVDETGDGIAETLVPCHTVSATGSSPGVILDGTQLEEGSDLYEYLGTDIANVNGDPSKLPFNKEWLAGYAIQVNDYTGFEVRYINRELGRVLEDIQFASNEQIWNGFRGALPGIEGAEIFPGHGYGAFGAYVLANPGTNVNTTMFPLPVRDYEAFEFTFNRRLRDGWLAYANYRYATLEGNYEGSYRNDNGQSDPFITSLFDLPAASAVDTDDDGEIDTYVQSGTLAGQYTYGPLNTDRKHIINAFLSKQFDFGLNVGVRGTFRSGQPRFPLLAHPTYRNSGEIPGANPQYWNIGYVDMNDDGVFRTADGDRYGLLIYSDATTPYSEYVGDTFEYSDGESGVFIDAGSAFGYRESTPRLYSYDVVKRDAFGRNPSTFTVDLSVSYDFKLGTRSKLTLRGDVFNIFNDTDALGFDDTVENRPGTPNQNYLKVNSYQAPRSVRLGAIFTF